MINYPGKSAVDAAIRVSQGFLVAGLADHETWGGLLSERLSALFVARDGAELHDALLELAGVAIAFAEHVAGKSGDGLASTDWRSAEKDQ